jgi:hypothetical protein
LIPIIFKNALLIFRFIRDLLHPGLRRYGFSYALKPWKAAPVRDAKHKEVIDSMGDPIAIFPPGSSGNQERDVGNPFQKGTLAKMIHNFF